MKPQTFAARLQSLLDETGVSVAALAKAAGVNRQTIYKLLRGQNEPSLEVARKLAAALGKELSVWE